MRKVLMIAASLAFAATTAMAAQLETRPIQSQDEWASYVGDGRQFGRLEVLNEDWCTFRMEINENQKFVSLRQGLGGSGYQALSGHRYSVNLSPGRYTMEGDNGRQLQFDVNPHRTVRMHLIPEGDNSEVGTRVVVRDGHGESSELLLHWSSDRPTDERPPSQRYQSDGPYYAGPPIVPTPPPEHHPYYVPPEPPHHYGPPIQMPQPEHHYGPPIQMHHNDPMRYLRR